MQNNNNLEKQANHNNDDDNYNDDLFETTSYFSDYSLSDSEDIDNYNEVIE